MLDNTKVQILRLIITKGFATVNDVVKELGLSWGAAQWHLFWLENNGFIKSGEVGGVRIYVVSCATALRKLEAVASKSKKTQ